MSLLAGGCALVVLGVRFPLLRLDDADRWGSVVAALVALVGLPMTVYGLVLARRAPGNATSEPDGAPVTFHGEAHVRASDDGIAFGPVGGNVVVGRDPDDSDPSR